MDSDQKYISSFEGSDFGINISGLAPGQKVGRGRYTLKRLLGQGGMGVVWQAQDERLQVLVALKFLPPLIRFDAAALDHLRAETRRSMRLSHPNIVRIHDLYEAEGEEVFFSMEYVDGATLSALRMQEPKRVFSWNQLVPWLAQLFAALEYAHGEGTIHRDLKPSNLMLDSRSRLKLADFGVARVLADTVSSGLTGRRGGISGTLLYMGPQQLEGRPPRPTDDIYSIGATIFELLTGKPPFHSGDVSHQVRNLPAPRVSERLSEIQIANPIPELVDDMVAACLEKDPDRRPQGVRELAERLGLTKSAVTGGKSKTLESDRGTVPSVDGLNPRRRKRTVQFAVAISAIAVAVFWYSGFLIPAEKTKPESGRAWDNSLGMKFVPVGDVLFSIWETRVKDFQTFAKATGYPATNMVNSLGVDGWDNHGHTWIEPGYRQGKAHPVGGMRWSDAVEFCDWLTEKERKAGWLGSQQRYRLPTDQEWSRAAGESEMRFPWGNDFPLPARAGNYAGHEVKADPQRSTDRPNLAQLCDYRDPFVRAAPVASFLPNKSGLYDMGGNLWEWCQDRYEGGNGYRVLRGGSWDSSGRDNLQISWRINREIAYRESDYGFRVVVELKAPSPGSIPAAPAARALTGSIRTNSLGMMFVEIGDVFFSLFETRRQDFEAFVRTDGYASAKGILALRNDALMPERYGWEDPGFPQEKNHPVVGVNLEDAQAFCQWLTRQEQQRNLIDAHQIYRLPTDREWSRAAGEEEIKYPWGNSWPPKNESGNYAREETSGILKNLGVVKGADAFIYTAPVGSYRSNDYGLYDLGGNVWEWCLDRLSNNRSILSARGGGWDSDSMELLQTSCRLNPSSIRHQRIGFRCVLAGPER